MIDDRGKLIITRASIDDLKPLSVMFDQYRMFYTQSSDIPAAQLFLKERIVKNESVIFIPHAKSEPIGFIQLYPIFSSVGLKRAWLLNDLYVDKKARGAGVATALLNEAKKWGSETGSQFLLLQTGSNNFTAQSLYEKNGWVKENDLFYRLSIATV